jgi:hypothetical protein
LNLRSASLLELSQELARFSYELRGKFRCPTCLRDFTCNSPSTEDGLITEEHIIPKSAGGTLSTFLCKGCNSSFGAKQTRWLGDWINHNKGKAPFPINPKKQKARATANGLTVNGSLRLAEDGAIEFISDRTRSDPKQYDQLWASRFPEISVSFSAPVFRNESALRVGYLTAAYILWFKHFGYSWILQRTLDPVRAQILHPEQDIIRWNYLIEADSREIKSPSVGLIKFRDQIFPFAHIYDHLVLLPSAKELHPRTTPHTEIFRKWMNLEPIIEPRFRNRCVGPSSLTCDGCEIISPDFFSTTTIPIEPILINAWT